MPCPNKLSYKMPNFADPPQVPSLRNDKPRGSPPCRRLAFAGLTQLWRALCATALTLAKKKSCWARCLCVSENAILTVSHLRKPSFASLLKTSFAATPCCALPPRIQRSAMLSPASWCLRCVRPRDAPSGSRLGFAGLMHSKKRSSPREAPPCKRLGCARLL